MDSIDKKIKEAVSQRMRDMQEKSLFEGISPDEGITLDKFFEDNDIDDYIWEESLEEALYSEDDELLESEGDQVKSFNVGDIIMTTRFKSHGQYHESPHRILIVTAKKSTGDTTEYRGYLLSSKKEKSNKYGGYPNNIYIKNYSTILSRGNRVDKEAFIRVDDLVSFTSEDLSKSGTWKGSITPEFSKFVQQCRDNYKKYISNADVYWDK